MRLRHVQARAKDSVLQVGDPNYKDLENSTWVGNGRFVLEGERLSVESRVSKVIPSTDMN